MFDDYSSCPQSGAKRTVVVKNVLRLHVLERMHVCVRVQTTDCSDKTWLILVTRRIKASQLLQSIVCAFRSIAGAATAEKLVLSH